MRAAIERGEREGAITIIDRSLPFAFDDDTHDRLMKTRAALTASLVANPKAK